ncbi:peptidoglycan-binding domain-containing protein [Geobacillus stearothermophilus]|uniref:peptidoglycan-binding domain-containing protein n=1 Tax=Geobacillus stearothermophilus TaxID=1422 RepID=UPI003D25317F
MPYPGKPLKIGSKGKDVERIQRALKVKVDGVFGKQTEAAVKAYQKRKGLPEFDSFEAILGK